MPEIEQSEPQPSVVRTECAHDWREYRHLMPIGISLVDGTNRPLVFSRTCPYYAIIGSRYCCAHTILHDAVTPETKADLDEFIQKSLNYYARGLLFNLPLPDGTLYYPAWWSKRFN